MTRSDPTLRVERRPRLERDERALDAVEHEALARGPHLASPRRETRAGCGTSRRAAKAGAAARYSLTRPWNSPVSVLTFTSSPASM